MYAGNPLPTRKTHSEAGRRVFMSWVLRPARRSVCTCQIDHGVGSQGEGYAGEHQAGCSADTARGPRMHVFMAAAVDGRVN